MKYIKVIILVIACACTNPQNSKVSESDVLGTWYNESMQVTFLDSDSVFKVPAGQWEAVLKIKPIETTYSQDYSFQSNYYALNDSLMFSSEGTWALKGDSLGLTTEGITTWYLFTFEEGKGSFEGLLDWDQDGIVNELYQGTQIKP